MSDMAGRVKEIIAEHLMVKPGRVIDGALLDEDLGADSLDLVGLMMAFEEEFGLDILEDDAIQVTTVGDAIRLVEKLAANENAKETE